MNKDKSHGATAAQALLVLLGVGSIIFGLEWAAIHALAELGQLVGIYDWEPGMGQTFFTIVVANLLGLILSISLKIKD